MPWIGNYSPQKTMNVITYYSKRPANSLPICFFIMNIFIQGRPIQTGLFTIVPCNYYCGKFMERDLVNEHVATSVLDIVFEAVILAAVGIGFEFLTRRRIPACIRQRMLTCIFHSLHGSASIKGEEFF